MKSKSHIQHHPNQEDKTGKATYASTTGLNSSTTRKKPTAVDMPEGAESRYKDNLLKSEKKKVKPSLSHKSKTPKK